MAGLFFFQFFQPVRSVQNCSDCLVWRTQSVIEGALLEVNMDRFVRSQNVERYRDLLDSKTGEPMRQTILMLLAEEQQKQKDAGDSIQSVL
jgi:hypothetical protein